MWRQSLFVFLCFAAVAFADDQNAQANKPKSKNAPKEGTYYSYGQVGVKKLEVDGSKIHLTFKPTDEQFHWCPGINVEKVDVENSKKQVTVVTFVRCKTSQNCGVDKKAKIGKRMIRTVSFNTNGLDVFVRQGSKFRRIHKGPEPEPKPADEKAKKSKAKSKKTGNARPALTLFPTKEHGVNRRVPNHHYRQSN